MSTTTIKYSAERGSRESRENTRAAIGSRTPFQTAGALFGTNSPSTVGQLPVAARERFYDTRNEITYAVYSYETPIAWFVSAKPYVPSFPPAPSPRPESYWVIVTGYFSNTTRRHQAAVTHAIKSLKPVPLVELVGE